MSHKYFYLHTYLITCFHIKWFIQISKNINYFIDFRPACYQRRFCFHVGLAHVSSSWCISFRAKLSYTEKQECLKSPETFSMTSIQQHIQMTLCWKHRDTLSIFVFLLLSINLAKLTNKNGLWWKKCESENTTKYCIY